MIIDESLLFFNKLAGDISRYMCECSVTMRKEQTKLKRFDVSDLLLNIQEDEKVEEPNHFAKVEESKDKRQENEQNDVLSEPTDMKESSVNLT